MVDLFGGEGMISSHSSCSSSSNNSRECERGEHEKFVSMFDSVE
jgi:hypothetical protein